MLIPLTRQTIEEAIPLIATGAQYSYVGGKVNDFLQRLLISLLIVVSIWLIGLVFGRGAEGLQLICFIIGGLYWFWVPVYIASRRNSQYRRFPYGGFWRGRVLDIYINEVVINETQQANEQGELIIVENIERRINVEIGDRQGFRATVQAPIKKIYKSVRKGMVAELLLLAKDSELENIDKLSDLYLPELDLWVGDYPCLRRDIFRDISSSFVNNPLRKRRSAIPSARQQ